MSDRHQIRETAVQLLYSLQLEGSVPSPSDSFEEFWSVLLEQDLIRIQNAKIKLIEHLVRDRDNRLAKFEIRLAEALPALQAEPATNDLADMLVKIQKDEHTWTSRLHSLFSAPKADPDNKTGETASALKEFFAINSTLIHGRTLMLELQANYPAFRPLLEPLSASAKKLQVVGESLIPIQSPLGYPEDAETTHIRKAQHKMDTLRQESSALVHKVISHLDEIDGVLSRTIENYSPERLGPVDRAVLRLGTYELLFRPDVPMPVAISEALDTATRFSGSDSARFVNGILDKVGKDAARA